jgi:hypothetical protein
MTWWQWVNQHIQLQPSWMEDRAVEPTGNFESRPLKDHLNAIWFHLNKWFLNRIS